VICAFTTLLSFECKPYLAPLFFLVPDGYFTRPARPVIQVGPEPSRSISFRNSNVGSTNAPTVVRWNIRGVYRYQTPRARNGDADRA
jgi:hypothetical protein